jgi:hypothetical protein
VLLVEWEERVRYMQPKGKSEGLKAKREEGQEGKGEEGMG